MNEYLGLIKSYLTQDDLTGMVKDENIIDLVAYTGLGLPFTMDDIDRINGNIDLKDKVYKAIEEYMMDVRDEFYRKVKESISVPIPTLDIPNIDSKSIINRIKDSQGYDISMRLIEDTITETLIDNNKDISFTSRLNAFSKMSFPKYDSDSRGHYENIDRLVVMFTEANPTVSIVDKHKANMVIHDLFDKLNGIYNVDTGDLTNIQQFIKCDDLNCIDTTCKDILRNIKIIRSILSEKLSNKDLSGDILDILITITRDLDDVTRLIYTTIETISNDIKTFNTVASKLDELLTTIGR